MPPTSPYSKYLEGRDPVAAIADTTARIQSLAAGWSAADYDRSYAPGKWTARQILVHLAQGELALGVRVRMALTTPGYAAQAYDQDRWLALEAAMPGPDALAAFVTLAGMNRALFQSLSAADRQATMSHPEYGTISADWIVHTIAGHQINHLRQLERLR